MKRETKLSVRGRNILYVYATTKNWVLQETSIRMEHLSSINSPNFLSIRMIDDHNLTVLKSGCSHVYDRLMITWC